MVLVMCGLMLMKEQTPKDTMYVKRNWTNTIERT